MAKLNSIINETVPLLRRQTAPLRSGDDRVKKCLVCCINEMERKVIHTVCGQRLTKQTLIIMIPFIAQELAGAY